MNETKLLVTVFLFMAAQTVGFVIWTFNENKNQSIDAAVITEQITNIREWQDRQDLRIRRIAETQEDIVLQQAEIATILSRVDQHLRKMRVKQGLTPRPKHYDDIIEEDQE